MKCLILIYLFYMVYIFMSIYFISILLINLWDTTKNWNIKIKLLLDKLF